MLKKEEKSTVLGATFTRNMNARFVCDNNAATRPEDNFHILRDQHDQSCFPKDNTE